MSIEKFMRKDLEGFGGYSAHTSPETLAGKIEVAPDDIIKIDANENPYGYSPRVLKALNNAPTFNVYPDNLQGRLRKLLEEYTGVSAVNIVAGSGSNQLIDLLLRLLLDRGDEVIDLVPTFGIYRFSTRLCGGRCVEVKRDSNFAVPVDKVKAAITPRTKIIILANPNNPSGNLTPENDIIGLLETGVPVLVDEAYYEFAGTTVAPLMKRFENLFVLRTFSKWAGLAGLRIGYGFFPAVVSDYLLRTKIPYNINVAALIAVEESLKDKEYLMSNVRKIMAERTRMFNELRKLDWLEVIPSEANYILCRVLKRDAKELKQKLMEKGILVRYYDEPLLDNYVRFSVGKPEHTDALIKALRQAGG